MQLLYCKTRYQAEISHRLVFVAPTGDSEKIKGKNLSPLTDEAIDAACKRQPKTTLTERELEELKRRLKTAKNTGYQDMVRRFVVGTHIQPDSDEISALQEQHLKELRLVETNSKATEPWRKLIHKYAKSPRYDEARLSALELYEKGGSDGKKLVEALVDGNIEFPENFVKYAQTLLNGTEQEKNIIKQELKNPDKTLGFRISVKLNTLQVEDKGKAGVEVAIDGLREHVKTKEKAALKAEPEPLSEYTLFRRRQLLDAEKQLKTANDKYAPLQEGLRSFVEKDLEASLSAQSTTGDANNTAEKKMDRFWAANQVYLEGANGTTPQQKLRILISNRILDSAFLDQGDAGKIFNQRWADLTGLAAKYGVKLTMPDAHKAKILNELREMGAIDKAKNECEAHLRVIREIQNEQSNILDRQKGESEDLIVRRSESGLGELPPMMDREGNYKGEVKTNIPLLVTQNGQTLKVKLTSVKSEAQTPAGRAEREEIKDEKELTGIKGQLIYQVESADGNGKKFIEKMSRGEFLEYIRVNNARRDFSEYPGQRKIEVAEEILAQQNSHKANIKIAKGFSFIHEFRRRQRDGSIQTQLKIVTIKDVDAEKGTITLDEDIRLFAPSSYKFSSDTKDRSGHQRPKGKPMELGEFLGWIMGEEVAEHFEENPDLQDETQSTLNQKLLADHQKKVAFEDQAAETAQQAGDQPLKLPSKPLQVTKDWSIVQSASSGKIYAIRKNPTNVNGVQIAEIEREKPKLHSLGNSGAEALHINNTAWRIKKVDNKHVASALYDFRSKELEPLDEELEAQKIRVTSPPQRAADAEIEAQTAVRTIKKEKEGIAKALEGFKVEEGGALATAALEKAYDNELKAAAEDTPPAAPEPVETEEKAMQRVVEGIRDGQVKKEVKATPHAIPDLNLKDPDQMSYTQVGFMHRLWMNTTFLSNSDIFEMGKSMYEYLQRRWQRNTKNRFSKVGALMPYFATEMGRVNQNAETEEMQQFKDAMSNWGIWQIEDALYGTSNRDQAKACLVVLGEKGKIRWENTRLWASINKFTEPKYFVPIPKNGDAQMRDPRTGHTGIQLLPAAIDSLWGQGQYNDWYTQNASKYQSTTKQYFEEGKQLDHDPYNNGSIDGRLKQMLEMHKQGTYVDNQEYEGLLHYSFEAGKSTMENKFYFIVAGVTQKNDKGETILTWDRLGSLDSEYLARLPWLDYFTDRGITRADGTKGGWNRRDLEKWVAEWDGAAPPGKENQGMANPALWKFLWTTVFNHPRTIVRTNKALRNAENMDHDDAHFIIPLASEMLVEDVLKGPTGGKKYFTYEGYANAFGGYSELLKARAGLQPPKTNLVFSLLKSFVRFESILSNRLHRDDKSRYARMDTGYWGRPSVVSDVNTGVHKAQMQRLVLAICNAYGYDASQIFKDLPQGDEFRNEQRKIEFELLNFGKKLEDLIKSDGGKRMMEVSKSFVDSGEVHGLSATTAAAAARKTEEEKEEDNEMTAGY